MTTIACVILQFESMIKKEIVANHTFFAVVTFSKIKPLCLYQFYSKTAFIISNLQKNFNHDNLLFVCLQCYKYNCLNILVGNVSFHMQVENKHK